MVMEIKNSFLKIEIASRGGELRSAQDSGGREYLWQGNSRYWEDRAPNLFPYIARLTNGKYRFKGREYSMEAHGFLHTSELRTVWKRETALRLTLAATEETKRQYPFEFEYFVEYRLEGRRLDICYEVHNTAGSQENKMYFGIGGHPGFQVPLDDGLRFEDYYLEFGGGCSCRRIGFSEDHFITGEEEDFPLPDNRLPLKHELFDDDAIVLRDMPDSVELASRCEGRFVKVCYPQMKYLGIWHAPHTDAPYVCIEPWSSLPSRKGIIEELETQDNLVTLEAGAVYKNNWCIEFGYR